MEPESQSLRDNQGESPRFRFDEQGRIIPPTEEERKQWSEAWNKALDAIVTIPDDPHEDDEVFWRAMDESRPHRPLFRELYEK